MKLSDKNESRAILSGCHFTTCAWFLGGQFQATPCRQATLATAAALSTGCLMKLANAHCSEWLIHAVRPDRNRTNMAASAARSADYDQGFDIALLSQGFAPDETPP